MRSAVVITTSNRPRRVRKQFRRDDHIFGLFVVETKAGEGRWCVRTTCRTARAAQDYAWVLLMREGGFVRVRQGHRIVAEGVSCEEPAAPLPL